MGLNFSILLYNERLLAPYWNIQRDGERLWLQSERFKERMEDFWCYIGTSNNGRVMKHPTREVFLFKSSTL